MENNPIVLHEIFDGDFKNMNNTEISSSIIDQYQQVIALYTYLKGQAVIPHHEELLNNLLKLENQEIVLMAQGLNRFQDM